MSGTRHVVLSATAVCAAAALASALYVSAHRNDQQGGPAYMKFTSSVPGGRCIPNPRPATVGRELSRAGQPVIRVRWVARVLSPSKPLVLIRRLRRHGFSAGVEREERLGTHVFAARTLPADNTGLSAATRRVMRLFRTERTNILRGESPPNSCQGTYTAIN